MGGGFGGKEGNASIFSQSAALAAFICCKSRSSCA
jgi:xanthine dehydrogenase large subunit